MSDILVSINCITFNHEKYIADALDSFLMQKTDFKYEILIHDDASTDKTADIIREYHRKYPDIVKPVLQNENQFSKGIRRIATKFNIPRARGIYIASCEGDDYWTDEYKLQKQVNYMESNPDCGLCFHASHIVDANQVKIAQIRPFVQSRKVSPQEMIVGGGGFIATNSIMYRRELLYNKTLPFFFEISPVGDYPLQIYATSKKYGYYIDEYMSVYRKGVKGSWTSKQIVANTTKKIKHNKDIIRMLNEFNKFTEGVYFEAVNLAIQRNEIQILLLNEDFEKLKSNRYKPYFKSVPFTYRIKLYIRIYFPKLYKKLSIIKK